MNEDQLDIYVPGCLRCVRCGFELHAFADRNH